MGKLALYVYLGLALFLGVQQWRISVLDADLRVAHKDIQTLGTNRDELAEALSSSEKDNYALNQQIKRREQILLHRNKQLAVLRTQSAELADKLEGLRKTNEKVKLWSIARVPDAVIRLLGTSTGSEGRRQD